VVVFRSTVDRIEHLALVKGEVRGAGDILARVHSINLFEDIIGERRNIVSRVMEKIAEAGCGVCVLVRNPRSDALVNRVRSLNAAPASHPLREYGIGAQILMELGVSSIELLSTHTLNVAALKGYELRITRQVHMEMED